MNELEDAKAQTEALNAQLQILEKDLSNAGAQLTKDLARALIQGKELDGILQKLVLSQADRALNSALQPVYDLVGNLGSSLVGAVTGPLLGGIGQLSAPVPNTIFNVQVSSPDPTTFRASETQIASSLSRAVTRGTRGL